MKTSTLGIIAFVALLAIAAITLMERWDAGTPDPDEPATIFRADRDRITQITLLNNDRNIQLSRQAGEKWRLEKPLDYPADDRSVAMLLTDMELSTSIRTIALEKTEALEKQTELFGLNRDDSLIRIKSGDETHELIIGEPTVRPGQFYAMRRSKGKSEILIIDNTLPQVLDHPLTHWRSKHLLDLDPSTLQTIVLREEGQETRLEKQAGGWVITKPLGSPVDSQALERYLSGVTGGQVQEFIDDPGGALASYGLNSPALVLEFHGAEGEKTQIRIGGQKQDSSGLWYGMTSLHPTVFTLTAALRDSLRDIVSATRDRRLIPVRTAQEIQSIRFKSQESDLARFTVTRGKAGEGNAGGAWVFQNHPDQEVDPEVIGDFLQSLVDVRAGAFTTAGDAGATAGTTAHSEFEVNCGGDAYTIQLGARTEDTQAALSTYLPFQMEIDRALGDRVPRDRFSWYPRTLAVLDTEPVRIEWTRSGSQLRLERDPQGNWTGGGEGKTIESSLLERQVDLLKSLKVLDRFQVEESLFQKPVLVLTLSMPNATKVLEFIIPPGDGKIWARETGNEAGFVLSENDYLTLETFPILKEN